MFDIRELLRLLLKSINFPKISDMHCRKGEYSKFFPWTRSPMAVDGIITSGGIVISKGY